MRRNIKFYRLNYQITAPEIRLLDEEGKQIGVVTKFDALKKAQAENKDLVEIAPNAKPPVVKLIDFKKFKYLEAKKERESRKSVKHVGVKETRLSPTMSEHDLKVKVTQAEGFLKAGNQVKISLLFRGREITHKEFGFEVINKAIKWLDPWSKVVKAPYLEGRVLVSVLVPVKKGEKVENEQTKNQKVSS